MYCKVYNLYHLGLDFRILADAPERTIKTLDSLYGARHESVRVGLLQCLPSFQRLVKMAMTGLINVIIYIDDILLHLRNHFEHRDLLKKLFISLRNAGLKVNVAKCEFGAKNVGNCRYRLTPDGFFFRI